MPLSLAAVAAGSADDAVDAGALLEEFPQAANAKTIQRVKSIAMIFFIFGFLSFFVFWFFLIQIPAADLTVCI